jgi:hypothetical protein
VLKIVSRFAGAPDEIAVELDKDGGDWRSLGTVKAAQQRSRRMHAIVWLTDRPATFEEILERAAGPSKNTVRRRLGELVREGLAERLGEGVKGDPARWRLTENGLLFVSKPPGPGWDESAGSGSTKPKDSSHGAGGYSPSAGGTNCPEGGEEPAA